MVAHIPADSTYYRLFNSHCWKWAELAVVSATIYILFVNYLYGRVLDVAVIILGNVWSEELISR